MTKKKTTLEDVLEVIDEWSKDNDVCFIGKFASFDKDDEMVEDRIIGYGHKDTLKMGLNSLTEMLKNDKEEFINW